MLLRAVVIAALVAAAFADTVCNPLTTKEACAAQAGCFHCTAAAISGKDFCFTQDQVNKLAPGVFTCDGVTPKLGMVDHTETFLGFIKRFDKTYKTAEEYAHRFGVFVRNLARAAVYNALEGSENYGVTQFADLTEEEFKAGYVSPVSWNELAAHQNFTGKKVETYPVGDAPTAFDWRDKGAVTEVKNQGQCGSCWAFSTTGNLEGQWFLKKGKLVSLSEQNIVDCDTVDEGCNGGLPSNAYQFIQKEGGVMPEADYPYKGTQGTCAFKSSDVAATVSGWQSLPTDETQLAAWLAANGPISIGINAGPMQLYFGGVSDPWTIFCNPKNLDHGVLLVGYDQKPADGSKPYWIIKNSWGPSWGEKGYYRIVFGKGSCGLNTMATSAEV